MFSREVVLLSYSVSQAGSLLYMMIRYPGYRLHIFVIPGITGIVGVTIIAAAL